MRLTLFEKAPKEMLLEVHQFINETQLLLTVEHFQSNEITTRQKQISVYLEQPKYAGLPDRLKRSLRKLAKEMNPSSSMDTEEFAMAELVIEPSFLIQLPTDKDFNDMRGMPAGAEEDQALRLSRMAAAVNAQSKATLISTDKVQLSPAWNQLFYHIDHKNMIEARRSLGRMAANDSILLAVLKVHPLVYLEQLIAYCIEAQTEGFKKLNADVLLTPKTFELLIRDLATTLLSANGFYCSFGLPTHHAHSRIASGFCILNKVAIVIHNDAQKSHPPEKFVIIGTDVNRDNGLCSILQETASHLSIDHIDVFDSHVYPYQDSTIISQEFGMKGKKCASGVQHWSRGTFNYYAVDLHHCKRKKHGLHPALLFALNALEQSLVEAKKLKQKICLYLPTGWDSHQDETAFCGKFIDGAMMGDAAAKIHRFNDRDLSFFYQKIVTLYQENHECFSSLYWGLEGGYEPSMYLRQIKLMLGILETSLLPAAADIAGLQP